MATIILENVSAHFPIYGAQQRSLRKALFQRATGGLIEREGKNLDRVTVKALTDISLTLHDGDRLGLIGHNGAGKSTLLRLMAGIYEPVAGTVRVEGRVTPLFDAMPGLDSEDTGYENIITSGMLMGMTRQQVEAKIPEIEEFCELGEYLTLPVRTYSSGMTMRLGFALVTALDPGVLLMDEGFGTGDLRFTERAQARMQNFVSRSRIMVLASHSDRIIRSMCNKAVLMEAGRIVAFGPVSEVCDQYYDSVHIPTKRPDSPHCTEVAIRDVALGDRLSRTTGAIRFTGANALGADGEPNWSAKTGETITFRFDYEVHQRIADLMFLFRLILPSDGLGEREQIVTDVSEVVSFEPLEAGHAGTLVLTLPDVKLMPNSYSLYVSFQSASGRVGYDVIDGNVRMPSFSVSSEIEDHRRGLVSIDYTLQRVDADRRWDSRRPESCDLDR